MNTHSPLPVLLLLAAATCPVAARDPLLVDESRVIDVCLSHDPYANPAIPPATASVARMFGEIGIRVNWHAGQRFCKSFPERTFAVRLSSSTPSSKFPEAWAYARPFEARDIEVFFDRVVRQDPNHTARFLAYVLVHEITHLLQGSIRHSSAGIMKARWRSERFLDFTATLALTEEDVELIFRGMNWQPPSWLASR